MDTPGAIIITFILVVVFLPMVLNPLGTLRKLSAIGALGGWIWASIPGHAWWWWIVAAASAVIFFIVTFTTEPVQERR